jgi:mono/diheme cytochrome c family protein
VTRKLLLVAVLVTGAAGCNTWYNEVPSPDNLMHAVPWFDHMILSKAVHPYQRTDIPRETPAGSVPITGGEADWRVGNVRQLQYGFDVAVANTVTRPVEMPALPAERGAELYGTYCAVCHGYQGDGNSAMKSYLAPPSLLMGQYGDKITRQDERWAVVEYVRSLQAAAPLPATANAGGAN